MRNPLWRLTRNDLAYRVYDRLVDSGIRVSKMDRYACDCAVVPDEEPPTGVGIDCRRASEIDRSEMDAFVEPAPIDRVITARENGAVIGYVFLSHNRPVYVSALETEQLFDGAYVWRLSVAPEHRGRNVGSALVSRAVREAATLDADRAYSLVPVDDSPVKRVFRNNGFKADRRISYYRVFGFEHRSSKDL